MGDQVQGRDVDEISVSIESKGGVTRGTRPAKRRLALKCKAQGGYDDDVDCPFGNHECFVVWPKKYRNVGPD